MTAVSNNIDYKINEPLPEAAILMYFEVQELKDQSKIQSALKQCFEIQILL